MCVMESAPNLDMFTLSEGGQKMGTLLLKFFPKGDDFPVGSYYNYSKAIRRSHYLINQLLFLYGKDYRTAVILPAFR